MSSRICSMLKTLTDKEKRNWKNHVNKLIFPYNCTSHSSTKYSSSHLLFGYKPRLPIDSVLDQSPKVNNVISYEHYLCSWEEAMRQAYSIAGSKSKEKKVKDKNRRAKEACLGPLHVSDIVLVRNCTEHGGTKKLRSYWENDIYKIVDWSAARDKSRWKDKERTA